MCRGELGSGASVVQFAGVSHTDDTVLLIDHWTGTVSTAGGTDRLLFAGDKSAFEAIFEQADVTFLGFETGYLAINPWANFNISGSFLAETFALCAPGMPQAGAKLALHYTHVAIDAEPAQSTQFTVAMVCTAFDTESSRRPRSAARLFSEDAVKKLVGLSSAVLTFLPVARRV
jgi:hypothetical protein